MVKIFDILLGLCFLLVNVKFSLRKEWTRNFETIPLYFSLIKKGNIENNGRQDFTIGERNYISGNEEKYIMNFFWFLNIIFHYKETSFSQEKPDSQV